MKDFYKILGVNSDASAADIKKSYRQLAQKYHPDKNPSDPAAEKKFKEIVGANEILSDPQKRQKYDFSLSRAENFGGINNVFEDLFGAGFNPFGGHDTHQGSSRRQDPTPDDAIVGIDLTLREIEDGTAIRTFNFTKKIICQACGGKGGGLTSICNPCQGTGHSVREIRQGQMTFHVKAACAYCAGSGQKIINPCVACGTAGVVSVNSAYKIIINSKKL